MADFPYFPFYVKDWLTGQATTLMTPEQKGAFIDLLAHAWPADPPCSLPDDPAAFAKLSGLGARWKTVGNLVREQFTPIEGHPGRVRNPKQWQVYAELQEYRTKKSTAGKKGSDARWGTKQEPSQTDSTGMAPPSQEHRTANGKAIAEGWPALALPLPPALAPAEPENRVAVAARALAIRANQGLAEHPSRPQLMPRIMAGSAKTHLAAEEILNAGVPLEFAETEVYELARTHNADGEVKSLSYLAPGVIRAWRQHEAQRDANGTERPTTRYQGAGENEFERLARELAAKETAGNA